MIVGDRTKPAISLGVLALLVVAVEPAVGQSGGSGGGALGDVIVAAIQEALKVLFTPIEKLIEQYAGDLVKIIVETPAPDAVFDEPSNNAWPAIYEYYWNVILPLSLLLWALSVGLVIFFEATSHFFSGYHRSKLKKRAFTGLLGILSWWWIDALARQFIYELSIFLIPDLSNISLFQTLSFTAMGVLGIAITLATDLILFVIIAIIYFMRHVVLYLFTLLMPILIAFWVPGVGPFKLVSSFMKRLAGFYVPFLFMTVPVALLFRLGELLGGSFSLSMGGIGAWLTALVIPVVAVFSPLVLFWQAGALFFMVDRASHRVSAQRARARGNRTTVTARTTKQGGQNLIRGARGQPAVRPDGQTVLNSGNSRAHAAGSRLNTSGSRLRERFGGKGRNGGGGASAQQSNRSTQPQESRDEDFENLRKRASSNSTSSKKRTDDRDDRTDRDSTADDPPRYIQ